MSRPNVPCDGIIQILNHLPPHVRRTYYGQLTREDLVAVVDAVWKERDAKQERDLKEAQAEKQLTSELRPAAETFATSKPRVSTARNEPTGGAIDTSAEDPKYARGERRSHSAATSSDPTQAAAKKDVTDTVDLIGSFGVLQLGTRTYESSFENTGAETDDSETLVFKTEQDEENQGIHSMLSTANEEHPKNPPFVLYVSEQDGSASYKSIHGLPTTVGSELEKRFNATMRAYKSRVSAYRKLLRNPAKYAERPYCFCDQIFKDLKATRMRPPSFDKGGRLGMSADDKCIKDKMPCLHLICNEAGDGYVLCIVPLPEQLRGSAQWTELNFWVLE